MEIKWYCIAFAVVAAVGISCAAVGDYHNVQCKQVLAATTARTVEDINKMCTAAK